MKYFKRISPTTFEKKTKIKGRKVAHGAEWRVKKIVDWKKIHQFNAAWNRTAASM